MWTIGVPIALFGWIPLALVLMAAVPIRTAITCAFLGAWMFLPVAGYKLTGFPDYTKVTASSLAVLFGVALFDAGRLSKFQFRWFDVPMVAWCLVPMASSLAAGLGAYDGLSGVVNQVLMWGIPYFIGRVWFGDAEGLRVLALGLVIGGLVYVPLCLWEIRMSPDLHKWVYGFHQHEFAQTKRFGGFRPMVFMQHGLAVGMFMCMAALTAFALWLGRSVRGVRGVSMGWIVSILVVTAVLCKSAGAVLLMVAGIVVVLSVRYVKTPAVLVAVLAIPLAYMGLRTVGGWDGGEIVELAKWGDEARGDSLQFRMNSEDGVWALVQSDLLLGRGRFSYGSDDTEWSNDQRIVGDALWVIALGKYGIVGLASLTAAFVLPPLLLMRRWRAGAWIEPAVAPAAALSIVIALSLFDNLFNAMINPLFAVAIGAVGGCCGVRRLSPRLRGNPSENVRVPQGASIVASVNRASYPRG